MGKGPVADSSEQAAFSRLIRAARDGSPVTPELLVEWANRKVPGQGFQSAAEVARYFRHDNLLTEIHRLQARLFAPDPHERDRDTWDGRLLARSLQEVRQPAGPDDPGGLPPLYPRGLG